MRQLDRLSLAWWLWRGRAALKAGRVQKAERIVEIVEELAPAARATVEFAKQAQAASLAWAKRKVEEYPERAEPRGDYARALLGEGRIDEATRQVEEGMRLIGNDKAAAGLREEMLMVSAEIAFEQGRFERALGLFDQAAAPGFTMPAVHYYRGLCRIGLGDKAGGLTELVELVRLAHWAVPMRHRELIEERRRGPAQTA